MGIQTRNDLSLISFDNYPWTELVDPPVDVVVQPVEAMARATARRLIHMLQTGVQEGGPHEVFPAELLVRGSASAPGQAGEGA